MQELGERLSAEEFAEWRAMFEVEGLDFSHERARHGEQMVATLNAGGVKRKGGGSWAVADFAPADPWKAYREPPALPQPEKKTTQAERMSAFARSRGNG